MQHCASLARNQIVAYVLPALKISYVIVKGAELFMFETTSLEIREKGLQFCF